MKLLPYIPKEDHVLPLIGKGAELGLTATTTPCNSTDGSRTISTTEHLSQAGQLQVQEGTLFSPRGDQEIAIDKVCKGFEKEDRGKLILPCGAGKTLTSLWIKERMKPKITLALFPSISLLGQTRDVWIKQRRRPFESICVCSDKTVAQGKKKNNEEEEEEQALERSAKQDLEEEGAQVTTKSDEIRQRILQASSDTDQKELVIFSTYQSLERIQEALAGTHCEIDLTICDEAHNTAGKKDGMFTRIHDQNKIPSKKRLYMTATEKIVGDYTGKSDEEIDLLCDMDNPKIFGPTFHKMSFGEAIEQGIISDYKILAVGISKEEFKRLGVSKLQLHNHLLKKAMEETGATHALTFHSRVQTAKKFAEAHKELVGKDGIDVFHVNGKMPAKLRKETLQEKFIASRRAVLTNSKCLREGVDAPGIDMVFFSDPKSSVTDIVQGASRANRKDFKNPNKIGYIVVPMVYSGDINQSIDKSSYKILINTVSALAEHDERLVDELRISSSKANGKGDEERKTESQYIDSHFEVRGLEDSLSKIIKSTTIRSSRKQIEDLIYPSFAEAVRDIKEKIPGRPQIGKFDSELQIHTGLTFRKLQALFRKEFPSIRDSQKNILDEIYGIEIKTETEPEREEVVYPNFIELARDIRRSIPENPFKVNSKLVHSSAQRGRVGLNLLPEYNRLIYPSFPVSLEKIVELFREEIHSTNPNIYEVLNAIWSVDIEERKCPYTTQGELLEAIGKLKFIGTGNLTAMKFFAIDSPLRTQLHLTADDLRRLFEMPDASLADLLERARPTLSEGAATRRVSQESEKQALRASQFTSLEGFVTQILSFLSSPRLLEHFSRLNVSSQAGRDKLNTLLNSVDLSPEKIKSSIGLTSMPEFWTITFCKSPFSNFKQAAEAIWEATNGQVPDNLIELLNSKYLAQNVGINLFELRELYGKADASLEELKKAIFDNGSIEHFHYESYLDIFDKLNALSLDNNESYDTGSLLSYLGISKRRLNKLFDPLSTTMALSRFFYLRQTRESHSRALSELKQRPGKLEDLSVVVDSTIVGSSKLAYVDPKFFSMITGKSSTAALEKFILVADLVKELWDDDLRQKLLLNHIRDSDQYPNDPIYLRRIKSFQDFLNNELAMSEKEFCLLFDFESLHQMFEQACSAKVKRDYVAPQKPKSFNPEDSINEIRNSFSNPPEDLLQFSLTQLESFGATRDRISQQLSVNQSRDDLNIVELALGIWGDQIPQGYWIEQLRKLLPQTRPSNLQEVFGKGAPLNSGRNQQEKDSRAIFFAAYKTVFPSSKTGPDYTTPPGFWQNMLANKVWTQAKN